MVKSKPSTVGAGSHVTRTRAGHYPSNMSSLVGSDGRISLNPSDYSGYTQSQVEMFLASQPYEVNAVFSANGDLVAIESSFKPGETAPIYDVAGATSFHNHPQAEYAKESGHHTIRQTNTQVFSSNDIHYYTMMAGTPNAPQTYALRSWDGQRFELEYVGGGTRDKSDFAMDYGTYYAKNIGKAQDRAFNTRGSHANDEMTALMDSWLRRNAGNYGFKYKRTWTMTAPA